MSRSSNPSSPPPLSTSSSSVGGASYTSPPSSYRQPSGAPSNLLPRPPLLQFSQSSYDDSRGGSFATYASADPFASRPEPPQQQKSFQSVSFQEGQQPSKRMSNDPQNTAAASQQSNRFSAASNKSRGGSKDMSANRNSLGNTKDGVTSRTNLIMQQPQANRPISASSLTADPEAGFSAANPNSDMRRKRSLVRPDRERMDPNHRQWYYRNHAAQMETMDSQGGPGRPLGFAPSTTGHLPQHGAAPQGMTQYALQGPGGGVSGLGVAPANLPPGGLGRVAPPGGLMGMGGAAGGGLRRGKSILGRDEDQVESGINILKRGVSLRRSKSQGGGSAPKEVPRDLGEFRASKIAPGPVGPWMIYCYLLTICCPAPMLRCMGIETPEQQRAWREKMGLIGIIVMMMTAVGYLTFGFTQTVCGSKASRFHAYDVDVGSMVFYGYDWSFDKFFHPQVPPFQLPGLYNHSNPVYSQPWSAGGKDGSLLFQQVDGKCLGIITAKQSSKGTLTPAGGPSQYFSCSIIDASGKAFYTNATQCHSQSVTNNFLNFQTDNLAKNGFKREGQVFYNWSQVEDPNRNLAVWKSSVLDLGRLNQIDITLVNYPQLFTSLKNGNSSYRGRDVTSLVFRQRNDALFDCLEQILRVGFVDSKTIGCVAADVELYISLVFIVGTVLIKFLMAVMFGWFLSWRLGNYGHNETYEQRMKRAAEIESWTDDIYRPAPASYRPNVRKHRSILPTTSRFSVINPAFSNKAVSGGSKHPPAASSRAFSEKMSTTGSRSPITKGGRLGISPSGTPPGSPMLRGVRSSTSLAGGGNSRRSSFSNDASSGGGGGGMMSVCPFPLHNVVQQPPPDFEPFGFPLAHTICLVTAYSESLEGVRTTLDSLATTDYPNSHKLLLVIADGIVKGAGSSISTPDICLSMMKELVVPAEDIEGNSYVAIADGYKRHNMAKVYAGFYDYDDSTVERSKQQRVPMILIAKCGTPLEAESAKPGNRGKRDSQVLLMAFMQKVMFDERMTLFEYEFFNAIWRVTGVSPDNYEIVLMVDADTKVFPDSLSRMVSCMVEDPEIMGLCGETKIANKAETWVTMIQVFEYYISHHQNKAFEACFGGVTCLPGCFSAYRIKAPKGPNGYWVPILANPDIVEHYSENVVDTLHKKNLLLLGEDRYLTTLMLKTFPKRKMMFVPQAVCKTVVPDTFWILLSQRRRWINSTVHNLAELIQVQDLCGTFCFSMRFVIFMELVGTLVLPAALAFTLYVVVIATIPSKPFPLIPLILLGVLFGLPGILIVVTSRRLNYVFWMFVYLLSLPIWNFVFPAYAFWHMDDFSWGATRVVQGDKGGHHGDAEGKFDPTNIVMKRWAEFERERRWKSGTHSRDSTYDVVHRVPTPERQGSTRYSLVSSDTFHSNASPFEGPGGRANLLAGAAAAGQAGPGGMLELPGSIGPDGQRRSGSPAGAVGRRNVSPSASAQSHGSSPPGAGPIPRLGAQQDYPSSQLFSSDVDEEKRPMISSGGSSPDPESRANIFASPGMPAQRGPAPPRPQVGEVRHGTVRSEQKYPSANEFAFQQAFSAEPEEAENLGVSLPPRLPASIAAAASGPAPTPRPVPAGGRPSNRGVSLVDDGPVASTQGGQFRQVTRGARRMSAQSPTVTSPTSSAGGALPGAVLPPAPRNGTGHATHESLPANVMRPSGGPNRQ
ncbi:Chitin synthase, class 3 [Tilletia horrida]|uniref:chitin synthase n=1 Tax=Tilletia horrida TaxID=155126 RepID=A0AAN6JRK4_9BASI|nr:Chitin synthase, class 3 [Tilletia horrida]